ncbi:MAG: demethoxyubiquinone hydroxylase family protein [Gammaproteobacteria bacterium]|nr:demethoxyubiquinone hydroxylase family protein [Gammaproteobacteria bacterium]
MKSSLLSESNSDLNPDQSRQSAPAAIQVPEHMIAAVRSDHAGESGAVAIYRGILAVSRDPAIREFARHHLATESEHLQLIEAILPAQQRSRLLPACRWAGWLTGALPALFGASAVYRTIDVVETFVDEHYREQIEILARDPAHGDLRELLERCRADEISHRDEARSQLDGRGLIGILWSYLVTLGSRAGVALVMRF